MAYRSGQGRYVAAAKKARCKPSASAGRTVSPLPAQGGPCARKFYMGHARPRTVTELAHVVDVFDLLLVVRAEGSADVHLAPYNWSERSEITTLCGRQIRGSRRQGGSVTTALLALRPSRGGRGRPSDSGQIA